MTEAEDAAEIISDLEEEGRIVDLVTTTPGVYNPDNNTISAASVASRDIAVLQVGWEKDEVDGTLILETDTKFLCGAIDPKPSVAEVLKDTDGEEYRIISVKPIKPGNQVYLYRIQARK